MYDHVDLFSGLGCWALAARANGLRTVAFCEREEWLATGLERTWGVPCHRDIKTFPAQDYAGRVWLLTGSPPCQPASFAGKRRGKADDRWLWTETIAVCEVIQPAWFIFENPPGLDGVGLDGIISDLERIGYEVATLRIPACAVDSPQLRDRFWIVGNSTGGPVQRQPGAEREQRSKNGHGEPTQSSPVANAESGGQKGSDGIACDGERTWASDTTIRQGCVYGAGQPTQSGVVADSLVPRLEERPSQPGNAGQELQAVERGVAGCTLANGDEQSWETGTGSRNGSETLNNPWQAYEWIPFNDALYRAPVGLYELAYESTVVIPKKFRSKIISALGNAIVWPVAAEIIKAIKASDPRRPTH